MAAALDTVESLKQREGSIFAGIAGMVAGKPPKAAPSASKSAITTYAKKLGGTGRRSATQAYLHERKMNALRVRDRVNEIVADPGLLAESLDDPDAWEAAPEITKARLATAARALAYLKSVEPRTFRPLFGGTELVDPAEIDRYEQSVQAVADPYGTLEGLWSGGLSLTHRDALDVVYPSLMNVVRMGVLEAVGAAAKNDTAVDYRARERLGMLLQIPISDLQRPGMFAAVQMAITPPPKPEAGAMGGRRSRVIEDVKAENSATWVQQREAGDASTGRGG
jgi:hypothetical protein